MCRRLLASMGALVVVIAVVSLALVPVAGQAPKAPAKTAAKTSKASDSPHTAWGDPDLQGTWNFALITPLERPSMLAGKAVLTEEEAAALEAQKARFEQIDPKERRGVPIPFSFFRSTSGGSVVDVNEQAYNSEWFDVGTKVVPSRRTSLIVDPDDGKIPYTPEAQKRMEARAAAAARNPAAAGPEDTSLSSRCVLSLNAGPPMVPGPYNNNFRLFQTRDYVVILNEMIHDQRVIPLDGRPHLPQDIRQWLGDSRGHWEGKTLVVDTTNFSSKMDFRGSSVALHVVERFTRAAANTITYEFTIEDPTTFARPWKAAFPMMKTEDEIFEYACHEGNRGLENILSAARADERAAEEAAKKR